MKVKGGGTIVRNLGIPGIISQRRSYPVFSYCMEADPIYIYNYIYCMKIPSIITGSRRKLFTSVLQMLLSRSSEGIVHLHLRAFTGCVVVSPAPCFALQKFSYMPDKGPIKGFPRKSQPRLIPVCCPVRA